MNKDILAGKLTATERRQDAFLDLFRRTGNRAKAAKGASITLGTVGKWLKDDLAFAQLYTEAEVEIKARLEGVAVEQAMKPRNFPERKFILSKLDPQKYGDRQTVEVATPETLRVILTDEGNQPPPLPIQGDTSVNP